MQTRSTWQRILDFISGKVVADQPGPPHSLGDGTSSTISTDELDAGGLDGRSPQSVDPMLDASKALPHTDTSFWTVPKIGNDQKQNEDYGASVFDVDGQTLRAVIADGASSTWCPGEWARILVSRFVSSFDGAPFDWHDSAAWAQGLSESRTLWAASLPDVRHELAYLNQLADEKSKAGAGSCLLVLECDLLSKTWRAISYGNCLLIHARSDEVLLCGPFDAPEQYDSYTPLISSVTGALRTDLYLWTHAGKFEYGDDFFLLTDELAKWSVRDDQISRIQKLRSINSQPSAEEFIQGLRVQRKVQDDDMSVIHVFIGDRDL